VALYPKKSNKCWILKGLDRATRKCIAWVTGQRDIKTVHKLYKKLSHLDAIFYTDKWEAFRAVLPQDRHIIGKAHTISIEQDNSNTRHNIGRFTRKTKIVFRSEQMVKLSMKLWVNINKPDEFNKFQTILCSTLFK
jgi:insertion element IS1 protein InsB